MNKMLRLFSIFLAFNSISFTLVHAGRTGQTAQEMRLGRYNIAKQINFETATIKAPNASFFASKQFSPALKYTALALSIVLAFSPIAATSADSGSAPVAQAVAYHNCGRTVHQESLDELTQCDSSLGCFRSNYSSADMCVVGSSSDRAWAALSFLFTRKHR